MDKNAARSIVPLKLNLSLRARLKDIREGSLFQLSEKVKGNIKNYEFYFKRSTFGSYTLLSFRVVQCFLIP